jgi:hypothetical protein
MAPTKAKRRNGDAPESEGSRQDPQPVIGDQRKARRSTRRHARMPKDLLDDRGRERPRFLLRFPRSRELDELVRAFEAGDYATVRSKAPELAERTADPEVRNAALELTRRIQPDPLMTYIFVVLLALLLYLACWAYGHAPH